MLLQWLETLKFGVTLLMKDLDKNFKSKFLFIQTKSIMKAKIDLGRDDMLINYTTKETMLMNNRIS